MLHKLEIKTEIPAIPPRLRLFSSIFLLEDPSDPFKDDKRRFSAGIRDSCPCILYNLIGPAGSKPPNKAELTLASAPVRQILLWIEEL